MKRIYTTPRIFVYYCPEKKTTTTTVLMRILFVLTLLSYNVSVT